MKSLQSKMIKTSFILLFSLATLTLSVPLQRDVSQYKCFEYEQHCLLVGVFSSKDEPNFEVIATKADEIQSVSIYGSIIPVLSNSLCNTFEALEILDLQSLRIEELHEDAFEGCPKLIHLALNNNAIRILPANIFRTSTNLRYLYLNDNKIAKIADNQFVMNAELLYLYLTNNEIETLPSSAFEGTQKLAGLSLATNDLLDIDENGLVAALPQLNYIELNHNEFACARLNGILTTFERNNVKVLSDGRPKQRFYETNQVGEFTCLVDTTWTSVFYRKLNTNPKDASQKKLIEEINSIEAVLNKLKAQIL